MVKICRVGRGWKVSIHPNIMELSGLKGGDKVRLVPKIGKIVIERVEVQGMSEEWDEKIRRLDREAEERMQKAREELAAGHGDSPRILGAHDYTKYEITEEQRQRQHEADKTRRPPVCTECATWPCVCREEAPK